ncbi:WD40 repeat-like protein [Lichtheimia hyalospora FSU 10163]|nr:WD40 repeat-like protein [Lichtheimia hyalospora FSU 10163]
MNNLGMHAESSEKVSTCFLSSFGNHINIWDALSEQEPMLSYKIDETPMNVASWSPHAPQTLIATGGCDKALKVIDTRVPPSNAIVWRAENAHSRPIRDAQFNPFIPYWIGTVGEDCLAQVFDLRATYHAPVARIAGHESIVRSFSWSNMRPENFMTTSNDGTMRMWMLTRDSVSLIDAHARTAKWSKKDTPPSSIRPDQKALWQRWLNSSVPAPWSEYNKHQYYGDEDDPWGNSLYGEPDTMMVPSAIGIGEWGRQENLPVFVGEDTETANGSVCRVIASKTRIAGYYGITDRGQVLAQTIRLEDHENLKFRFKFNKETDPIARQIEYYIYTRRIEDAREELEKLKQLQLDDPEQAR